MRSRAIIWAGIVAPIVLFAVSVVLVPRQTSWVMAIGVFVISLLVGWLKRDRFYVPAASALGLAALWYLLAAAWRGWWAANFMVASERLFFLSPFGGLLAGFLAARAESAPQRAGKR
jgi:general stress protein CsbA